MRELIERAHDRARDLLATAELFDEVAVFMDGVIRRTFDAYERASGTPECKAFRQVHIEALRIRDDYRGAAKMNREDAEMLAALSTTEQHSPAQQKKED